MDRVSRVINAGYEVVPLDKVRLHPRNPNRGEVGEIAESIRHNGFFGAIVAQRSSGYILAGNHRYQAAAQRGLKDVPVVWVDVDDEQALRILVADNQTQRLGEDDPHTLAAALQSLLKDTGTLDGTGYGIGDLEALMNELLPPAPREGAARKRELPEVWAVAIDCRDEADQIALVEELRDEGYQARARVL